MRTTKIESLSELVETYRKTEEVEICRNLTWGMSKFVDKCRCRTVSKFGLFWRCRNLTKFVED